MNLQNLDNETMKKKYDPKNDRNGSIRLLLGIFLIPIQYMYFFFNVMPTGKLAYEDVFCILFMVGSFLCFLSVGDPSESLYKKAKPALALLLLLGSFLFIEGWQGKLLTDMKNNPEKYWEATDFKSTPNRSK
jgi:hypothetical protein